MSDLLYKTGILTLSDKGAAGERVDESGPLLKTLLDERFEVVVYQILPDDRVIIEDTLKNWADKLNLNLILTTGGTGVSPRDVTPEATMAVIEKLIPGMAEAMRMYSFQKTPMAVISRAISGVRGHTLIINLPGSPKGARESLEVILPAIPHALDKIAGDPTECSVDFN